MKAAIHPVYNETRVHCACGKKMYVYNSWGKYVCRHCLIKISTADLEAVFQEQLKGFFLNPEEVARHLAQSDEVLKGKEESAESLRLEESKVRTEMDRVYRAYVSDQLSVEGFGRQYGALEARLKQIEEELTYPGQIRVTVVRESRASELAR
jgi:hypothetical protein